MGTQTQFDRPSLVELINRITEDHSSRMTGANGAVLRRSALGIISRAEAGAVYLLHGHLDWIANQIIIDTAEGEWLERWASIWKIYRKVAAFAAGSAGATGTNGAVIPAGTILVRSDGVEFETDDEQTIAAGVATLSLTAVVSDTEELSGNTAAGLSLTFQTPIYQVGNSVTVGVAGITGGAPQENDDDLRDRLLFRIQNPPRGGHLNDYIAWAREVSGVTRAWSFSHWTGIGKVGVTFMLDNSDPTIPDAPKLAEVLAYIETKRPATAKDIVVFAPALQTIDMTIKVDANDAPTKAAIEAELVDLFLRWEEPGATVYESQLDEAISIAAGEVRHQLVSTTPAMVSREITLAVNELPTLGTITWQSY